MPNPFVRLGAPRQQSTEAPNRPVPVAPVPESFGEPNFAYRGTEPHGVPANATPLPDEDFAGNRGAEFVIEPAPEHVIPVRIVQGDDSRTRRTGRAFQIPLVIGTDRPTLVLGQNDARTKASVRWQTAAAGDVVLFGSSPNEADPIQGHRFTGQAVTQYEFVTEAQNGVWALAPVIGGGSAAGSVILLTVYEVVSVNL